jgi:hypothetical protein
MKTSYSLALLLAIFLGACGRSETYNSGCSWPGERNPKSLDIQRFSDRRHLENDALLAEDLAIRYADRVRRSGQIQRGEPYRAAREHCMATLFEAVSRSHQVSGEAVRQAVDHRWVGYDALVLLPFAVLYAYVAGLVASRILNSAFGPSLVLTGLSLVAASVAVGIIGFGVGSLWSGVADSIRVGFTGHISYRLNRIPWRQHPEEMFASCMALFWLVAVASYRAYTRRPNCGSAVVGSVAPQSLLRK